MLKLKSQANKGKILFKLNDNLLKQNLPIIQSTKFKQKQNSTFSSTFNQGFRLSPKLPPKTCIKFFNLPQKFKKHNNKIQDNINILNKTSIDYHPAISKTCSTSFYKPKNQQHSKTKVFNKRRSQISLQQEPNKNLSYLNPKLQPKTLQTIQKYFQQKYNKIQEKQNIKKLTVKRKNNHRKISKQISQIFHQNKHLYMLSRFTLLQLKSYYCSILNFSKGDLNKFKYAFQIMLNLANVTVRQNIMADCLKQLINQGISFTKFLKTFTNIQQKLRKQTIIDYFQILLEDIKKPSIQYQQLIRNFQGRMKKQIALDLTILLYQKLGKQYSQTISKRQIHTLCYQNQSFCTKFYVLNNQNMLTNKFNNYPDY